MREQAADAADTATEWPLSNRSGDPTSKCTLAHTQPHTNELVCFFASNKESFEREREREKMSAEGKVGHLELLMCCHTHTHTPHTRLKHTPTQNTRSK